MNTLRQKALSKMLTILRREVRKPMAHDNKNNSNNNNNNNNNNKNNKAV